MGENALFYIHLLYVAVFMKVNATCLCTWKNTTQDNNMCWFFYLRSTSQDRKLLCSLPFLCAREPFRSSASLKRK